MLSPLLEKRDQIQKLVKSFQKRIYVRRIDDLLIIMPNESIKLNPTASRMLKKLLNDEPIGKVISDEVTQFNLTEEYVENNLYEFITNLSSYLNKEINEQSLPPSIAQIQYKPPLTTLPVLSEIALTYRCNNKCLFCYAASDSSPQNKEPDMTIEQGKIILDTIKKEVEIPSVSFTGGEPTLCKDVLLKLIEYASKNLEMRVNLISNGTTLTEDYVKQLKDHGLDSAQISLEGGTEQIHDYLTQHPGSFKKAVNGILNLKREGIFVHTNTTISNLNKDDLSNLIELIATKLKLKRFSANMIIPSGWAIENLPEINLKYSEIGPIVRELKHSADKYGLEFFWYSPTPYCLFNPLNEGLGMKSCSACDGLLSISPSGTVKPCSSFEQGVGNILIESFTDIWNNKSAQYWRKKKFLPPECSNCSYREICVGACPLYFDVYGLDEIMNPNLINKFKTWRMTKIRKKEASQGSFNYDSH